MNTRRLLMTVCAISLLNAGCGSKGGKSFLPPHQGYDDSKKQVFILPDELLEISGLVHLEGEKIAAINDEKGIIYFLDLATNALESFRFKGKGDYEELAKAGDTYYVLDSDGDLTEVKPPSEDVITYHFQAKGKIEFESLVYNKSLNKLILITKDQRKKKSSSITAYSFDLATKSYDPEPFFEIPLKDVFVKIENYNADCKPSGASINPVNGNLYIIASVGKLLLECDSRGRLLRIFKINPAHFPQPEGISFAANGDMYISNEGLEGKATILKYPYVEKK